uniref:Omega-hydroxypalmitate O-feruloyl transferase n=1 Tax=Anthurium amnicola TaxID=1678845 RepID=A0A1D1YBX0_9ARAE
MATLCEGEYLVRSFCFDPEAVEQVKRRAIEDGVLRRGCTTFEAVAGFVLQARTKAMRMRPHQQTRLLCSIDIRRRLDPSLQSGYFGNGIVMANWVGPAAELLERPISFAVGTVQEAVQAVTNDYVRSLVDYVEATRGEAHLSPATPVITTWYRLPFHAIDFGWGEPLQCGPPALIYRDIIMFLPRGKDSDNITVLLGLPSTAMVTFQELFMQVLRGDM